VAMIPEYTALNVPSMNANHFYLDPTTKVKIWKVTDGVTPVSNTSAGHDYSEGGPYCSRGWGPNGNTHTICVRAGNYYFVDFERGVGFSNWRQLPVGGRPQRDVEFCFSNNPATPQIAYVNTDGSIVRLNTATDRVENTGHFPHNFSGTGIWLHEDKNDEWFVYMDDSAYAWNSKTDEQQTLFSPLPLNEPRMERNGRYVALVSNGQDGQIWDLSAKAIIGTVYRQPYGADGSGSFAHNSSSAGFFISLNPDLSWPNRYFMLDPTQLPIKPLYISNTALWGGEHKSGNWIQDSADWPNHDFRQQWVAGSSYSPVTPAGDSRFVGGGGAQCFMRYNGGPTTTDPNSRTANSMDFRLLCHSYHISMDYFAIPFGIPSPDGKIFLFDSDMMGSGRYDLFVAEVPLKAGAAAETSRPRAGLAGGLPLSVSIFNIRGQCIRTFPPAGLDECRGLPRYIGPKGLYVLKLNFRNFSQTRKVMKLD